MSKKDTTIVTACPDQCAGNYPEALGLAFHQGPTFIVKLPQTWLIKTDDYQSNFYQPRFPIGQKDIFSYNG